MLYMYIHTTSLVAPNNPSEQTSRSLDFVVKNLKVSVGRTCLGNTETKLPIICSLQQALTVSEKIFTLGGKNISFFLPLCSSSWAGVVRVQCYEHILLELDNGWTTKFLLLNCCVVQCCLACVLLGNTYYFTLYLAIEDPVRTSTFIGSLLFF